MMKVSRSKLTVSLTVGHLGIVLRNATVEKISHVVLPFQG
jgi:hypothetical protein